MIKVICCKCGKNMGTKKGFGVTGISHGYCKQCLEIELKKAEKLAAKENELEKAKIC